MIKVLLQAQEAINNSMTEGSQIQNKMGGESASVGESISSLFRLHGYALKLEWDEVKRKPLIGSILNSIGVKRG